VKYLLDTHILLWAAAGDLPKSAKKFFLEENELYFSPASIWEIVIKRTLKRSDFQINPKAFHTKLLSAGYKELSITARHTLAVENLPEIHKDPFDRILLSQAISERMYLITADRHLANYPERVIVI
jgi:PIN domain nuclease of toxin-antitoxin system